MQLRGFVMLYSPDHGWSVSVCRDLDAVMKSWRARDENTAGVLHLGFDRPPSSAFEALARGNIGCMLLTASARFGLPAGYAAHPKAIGEAAGLPIFLATSGFGYELASDAIVSQTTDEPGPTHAFRGWLAMFVGEYPEYAGALTSAGIVDDESYLAREKQLDRKLRRDLGRFRYAHLVGGDDSDPARIARCAPPWLKTLSLDTLTLTVRIANVMQREKITTVGDLARFEPQRLMNTQNFGRTSYQELRKILLGALDQGPMSEEDGYITAESVTLREGMDATLARLGDRERDILVRRMGLFDRAETLAQIGDSHGVSRERIRQIEAKIVRRIIEDDRWDNLLTRKLEALLETREHPLPVVGVEVIDPWFAGIAENGDALAYILENMCGDRFHVVIIDDVPYFATFDQEQWGQCLREARALLSANTEKRWDEDHCRSVATSVLDLDAREFSYLLWHALRKECHFSEEGQQLILTAFGHNLEALVQAVLNESDRPMHFTKIAEAVAQRSAKEFDVRRVHNVAQDIGILFGRGLYGLDHHCSVNPETRAVCLEEVERIILEGPTERQWHCAELCQALADEGIEVEGLDKYALELILRGSDSLERLGRLMWTAKSQGGSATRTNVRQAIVTILREAEGPLSSNEIADRLSAVRGTNDALPLWNFDPVIKIDRGLWGLNDRDLPIDRATQTALFEDLANHLAEVGAGLFVGEVFQRLPQLAGMGIDSDLLCSLAAHHTHVRVNGDRVFYLPEWGDARRETLSNAVVQTLASTDGGATFDEVIGMVEGRIGRSCDRSRVSALLQNCGDFDTSTDRWSLAEDESEETETVDRDTLGSLGADEASFRNMLSG